MGDQVKVRSKVGSSEVLHKIPFKFYDVSGILYSEILLPYSKHMNFLLSKPASLINHIKCMEVRMDTAVDDEFP